ncbi:MAG: CpsD/CapB family tyrosine-protein kinase, partial [Bifidobacterium merycicum]
DKVPDRGQLLVISSTSPSEGKTTTVINVAAVLAENGAKVLLVDADLRHPSVAHHLGIEGSVGLAHVLSGQMSPVDVVQSYWKPNLHILPAGKRPANASLLLNSDMMKMLIEQALMQYDYVLIDTAPLAVSNDGIVFGSWAKGVVLVAANGICRKKDLEESMDALRTAKVPVLGFVFNFANPKKEHKNAYYYYYEDGARRSTPRRNGRKH